MQCLFGFKFFILIFGSNLIVMEYTNKELREKIQEILKSQITQEKIADEIGMTTATLSRFMTEKTDGRLINMKLNNWVKKHGNNE